METTTTHAATTLHPMRLLGFALNLLLACAVVAAIGVSAHTAHTPAPVPTVTTADQVAHLMTTHHCWTGEGPKGVIPGHAVVDTGNGPEYVDSSVGFAIWLDGKPGSLHGFCR